MPILFFALLTAVAGWVWWRNQPTSQRKPALLKLVILLVVLGMGFLAVTGRFYLVFGLAAALYPMLRRVLPGLISGHIGRAMAGGAAQPKSGNQSKVATDILDMTLDHDTGDMDGKVLTGPLSGKALADLGETEFIDLLQYCREQDADSARLLESYLDRRFGDSWRADDPAGQKGGSDGEAEASSGQGPLTEHEALDILGLEPGADHDEIVQAHRRLMQKMHPDRGGSTYLAARINEAKARLLD